MNASAGPGKKERGIHYLFCRITDMLILDKKRWNRTYTKNLHPLSLACFLAYSTPSIEHLILCPIGLWYRYTSSKKKYIYVYMSTVLLFYYFISPLCCYIGYLYFFEVIDHLLLQDWSRPTSAHFTNTVFLFVKGFFYAWILWIGVYGVKTRAHGDHWVALFRSCVDKQIKLFFFATEIFVHAFLYSVFKYIISFLNKRYVRILHFIILSVSFLIFFIFILSRIAAQILLIFSRGSIQKEIARFTGSISFIFMFYTVVRYIVCPAPFTNTEKQIQ